MLDTQIRFLTDTSDLSNTYFEDIDEPVSSQQYAYEVTKWYIYYFSTEEAAQDFIEGR